jgi:hypothetical protein
MRIGTSLNKPCANLAQGKKNGGIAMRLFEYCQREKLLTLSQEQITFVSNLILHEVNKAAEEKGISKEDAYWQFSHGLIEGSDRFITED